MTAEPLNVVIPLKGGAQAKSRLSAVMSPEQRRRLWWAMAEHVLQVVAMAAPDARRFVVSSCPDAGLLATRAGAIQIGDECNTGAADAYRQALDRLGREEPVLLLNGDLPILEACDIAEMVKIRSAVAIAPDRAHVGTNGLFLPANAKIEPQFGPDSFRRHWASAQATGLPVRIIDRASLSTDVDTPKDLSWASALANISATAKEDFQCPAG